MRWTKVRQLTRESFADSVRKRVDVRATNADPRPARQDWCAKGTIVVDRQVVAQIDPHRIRRLTVVLPVPVRERSEREVLLFVEPYRSEQKLPRNSQRGTVPDFPKACWTYLNSSLNESLRSDDPIVSSLAVLNAKVGRQRLKRLSWQELHPLMRGMLEFRIAAEREWALSHG